MWLDEWTRTCRCSGRVLDWWTRTAAGRHGSPPLTVAVIAQFVLFVTLVAWLLATFPTGLRHVVRR